MLCNILRRSVAHLLGSVNKGLYLTQTLRNFPCDKNNCGLPDLDSPFRTLCLVKEEELNWESLTTTGYTRSLC